MSVGASSPSGCTSTRWEMNSTSFASTNCFDPNYIHHAVCMWFIEMYCGLPEAQNGSIVYIPPVLNGTYCAYSDVALLRGSDATASDNRYCILFVPEDKMVQLYISNTSGGTKKKLRHEPVSLRATRRVIAPYCGTKNLKAINSVNSVI